MSAATTRVFAALLLVGTAAGCSDPQPQATEQEAVGEGRSPPNS